MRHTGERGQILPLTCLGLAVLIILIATNGERSLFGIQKVRHQTEIDGLALTVSSQQARALNSIAGLNQGLRTIVQRAYIVAGTYFALVGCSLVPLTAKPCLKGLAKLTMKAPPLFRKMNKLGKAIGKYQDQIADWAEKSPFLPLTLMNLSQFGEVYAFSFPATKFRLPIQRADAETYEDPAATPDEQKLASGKDLLDCRSSEIQNFKQIDNDKTYGLSLGKHDHLYVRYRGPSGATETRSVPPARLADIRPQIFVADGSGASSYYGFSGAELRRCTSFQDWLRALSPDGTLVLQIPAPYLFQAQFFEGGNRITLGLASKTTRDFDASTFKDFLNVHPSADTVPDSLWFVSEAEVAGEDLNEMDFDVRLSPTSQVAKLWDQINPAARLVFKPPYLSEFQDDLAH